MVKFIPCNADSNLMGFSTLPEMLEYICNSMGVDEESISIGEPHGHALMLNMDSVRLVTANQVPIGICSID